MMENPMLTEAQNRERFIPFSGLRYSTEAFIDYRIPGCAPKKNYALIGPGVSQNPNQPVSRRPSPIAISKPRVASMKRRAPGSAQP
jgi:hypothetical protein